MTSWNLRFCNLRILKFKCLRSEIFFIGAVEIIFLVLKVLSTPQNGQTQSNNTSATASELFECVWLICVAGA